MQEDTDYDAQTQTPSSSGQAHWYAHMRAFSLGYGCLEEQIEQCPKSFIPYIPEKLFERASSTGYLSTVDPLITSGKYQVDNQDSRRSKGTSFKEPEQRSKKHIRFNEVKGRAKQKTSIRFSDKPDVSWSMTEGGVITKMTEGKKKHDRKNAQVHSRLPSVKKKEDIKEQADWHHTRWKKLLRNYIKDILREELAVEHAKMRELLRKDVEEIRGLLRNELSQICMDQVALLKEQTKEIQQAHRNLQYLWLKDLFRRDLKEMVWKQIKNSKIIICPKEEPLPGPSQGTTDFQRTAPEQETKKNSKGAHDSAPAHSGKSVVQTEEESVDGQNDSHCTPLKDLIKEDLKENFCEILEKYTCDTCMKKELPHTFKGRKQLRKISTEQKLKKKYDSKSLYSEQPATKTVKKVEHEHGELQYVHLAEVIKKEFKVRTCEVLGKYETNVCPREEALPHGSKKKTRSKVEEKTSGYLYAPHFSSFEHRIAALRATAHVEPAPAACAGYAGDAAVDQQYLEAIKLISMLKLK
uniref:uncharacterized protein LOC125395707 isoform X2 n=1 Tax=Myodes glareolus TaxID=447135 RepID=UPI002022581F|nr:uncharacterized protein LOC125395707 isoform X2 [Myodes glareolus]